MKRSLFKSLGNQLLKKGRWFLSRAFKINLYTITKQDLEDLVQAKTDLPKNKIWQADKTYFYAELKTIKEILKYDLVSERKYESEIHDCDDFAEVINARFRSIYRINTMGVARNIDIRDENDQHRNYHRANVFVAYDGELKLYYLEPQTDYIAEILGKEVIIGKRKYILNTIDF